MWCNTVSEINNIVWKHNKADIKLYYHAYKWLLVITFELRAFV